MHIPEDPSPSMASACALSSVGQQCRHSRIIQYPLQNVTATRKLSWSNELVDYRQKVKGRITAADPTALNRAIWATPILQGSNSPCMSSTTTPAYGTVLSDDTLVYSVGRFLWNSPSPLSARRNLLLVPWWWNCFRTEHRDGCHLNDITLDVDE